MHFQPEFMHQHPNLVFCDKCGQPLLPNEAFYLSFVSPAAGVCPSCQQQFDGYSILLRIVTENHFANSIFDCIGANTVTTKIKLQKRKIFSLDLTTLGIGEDSRILFINYTPQGGGLFPIEMHGNTPQLVKKYYNKINLYPSESGLLPPGEIDKDEVDVAVMVTWISYHQDHYSLANLVEGLLLFTNRESNKAIIPLNVSVEERVTNFLRIWFTKNGFKNDLVTEFLSNGATYSYQWNLLLPDVMRQLNGQPFSPKVMSCINSLRKLRNEMGHQGGIVRPIEKSRMAEITTSVIIANRCVDLLTRMVESGAN